MLMKRVAAEKQSKSASSAARNSPRRGQLRPADLQWLCGAHNSFGQAYLRQDVGQSHGTVDGVVPTSIEVAMTATV